MLGIESDDVCDIEVGCTVWSETHQDSLGKVGGVVVAIFTPLTGKDAGHAVFKVVRQVNRKSGPDWTEIRDDEIDMQVVGWETREAKICATNLFAWLGNVSSRRDSGKSEWASVGVQLMAVVESDTWTPGARARYDAAFAARRQAELSSNGGEAT